MMNKLILAHYINVDGMTQQRVEEKMRNIIEIMKKNEDGILHFFYPVRNQHTRVECLNPKLVSEEEYREVSNVLKRNQEIVQEILMWGKESREIS